MNRYHPLTLEESRIIEHKGTEAPFSGLYDHHMGAGIYCCKRCDYPLFMSDCQFDSGCGWPSFDEAINSHVTVHLDADGQREEILCSRCHGHLGHVFKGERLTDKNTRHCVNSLSLCFIPAFNADGYERAVFAGGCFWGVEYLLKKEKGVICCESGYIGGHVINPIYEEVCSHTTGHLEAVEIFFDPEKTDYSTLAKSFFEIHNFSQKEGQGPDIGPQYLSKLFIFTKAQLLKAQKIIQELKNKSFEVATTIEFGMPFYKAEDYHQNYYQKTGKTPYCHIKKKIF
jgi:peptide methionine sulfoxide reductase msrA/msrB